jgi:hypothetical protein
MSQKSMTMDEYIITKTGEVINSRNNHILKPQPNSKGYLRVSLCGKRYFIHRLVAEKYIPNPENKEQVNHKDGNKNNNSVENLEWVTNQENRDHAIKNKLHLQGEDCPWSKLNQMQVDYIRADNTHSSRELADLYNVSIHTINDIKNYKTWKN